MAGDREWLRGVSELLKTSKPQDDDGAPGQRVHPREPLVLTHPVILGLCFSRAIQA